MRKSRFSIPAAVILAGAYAFSLAFSAGLPRTVRCTKADGRTEIEVEEDFGRCGCDQCRARREAVHRRGPGLDSGQAEIQALPCSHKELGFETVRAVPPEHQRNEIPQAEGMLLPSGAAEGLRSGSPPANLAAADFSKPPPSVQMIRRC